MLFRSFDTKVDKFWAVQEVGKVINPTLAEGQIIGGVAQGIGYALYEEVIWKDGKMANNKMSLYSQNSLNLFQVTWNNGWGNLVIWDTWHKRHIYLD